MIKCHKCKQRMDDKPGYKWHHRECVSCFKQSQHNQRLDTSLFNKSLKLHKILLDYDIFVEQHVAKEIIERLKDDN